MIQAEYFPNISRAEIVPVCKHKLPLSEMKSLGTGFAITAAEIAKAAMNAPSSEGLYRCVFPEGVTGHLAAFKDGSGMLGTIMNGSGIAGQVRWIPVTGADVPMAIDPVTLAIAVAMASMTKQLDDIKAAQKEILEFLQEDKESNLEGIVNSLSSIMEDYRYNSNNQLWLGSRLTNVTAAKTNAEQNIIFYRKQVTKALEKKAWLHSNGKVNKLHDDLQHSFKYYQMSVYIFAFSSFLEVVLGGNYSQSFLNRISEKISDYSFQYWQDYSDCYEQLEQYSHSSVQTKLLESMEKAGKAAGNAIAGIPVIRKGPIDEALIAVGDKLGEVGTHGVNQVMSTFRNNRDAGIQLFQKSIATINQMSNKPVEVLFDRETLYICD